MRLAAMLVVVWVLCAAPVRADEGRLEWPLRPRPVVVRQFDAPSPNWQRGHRGVDLATTSGQPVYAAAAGTVVFAGELAGRPLVSITHPGGLRTSYEPVRATVRAGQTVGAVILAAIFSAWGRHDGSAESAAMLIASGFAAGAAVFSVLRVRARRPA